MKLSYYTIDDLRLGHDPEGNSGWRQTRHLDGRDALEQYRGLPDTAVKVLGVSSGEQDVELIRRLPVDTGSTIDEDVLVLDFFALPLWKKEEGVIRLARELVSQLDIRYCLTGDRLVPAPGSRGTDKRLKDKYLWPDVPNIPESAIRWLYLAGVGWVSPGEVKRRFPSPETTYRYPVITRYKADGVTKGGTFLPLELSHWEYKMLEHRTKERLDHNQNSRRNLK